MKAPRSRQEATSGVGAVGEGGRLQRAARLVEGVAKGVGRRGAAGGGPDRAALGIEHPASLGCDVDRVAILGVDHRAEQLAPAGRVGGDDRGTGVGGERPLQRRLGRGRVVEGEDEHRRLVADPERLEAAAQLGGLEAAAQRPGEDVAGEAPLGLAGDAPAHQLEGDDGDRLLEDEALEVAEAAGVADDHHPGLRRAAARGDHRLGEGAAGRPTGAPGRTGGRRPSGTPPPCGSPARPPTRARGGNRGRRSARRGRRGSTTVPPTAEAIVAAISSSPRSSRTSRSSRRWTAMPRWSTSYCSLTRRAKAFSVIAMNGVE